MAAIKLSILIRALILLWLCTLALSADVHPTDQGEDNNAEPTSAPGKLLKLVLKKAEEIKNEKATYKEKHELKVQNQKGSRHDRAWAQQTKSDKDKQGP